MEASGWQRRSVHDETRLSEVVENYRELGFDVRTVELDPAEEDCDECFKEVKPGHYLVVYTK